MNLTDLLNQYTHVEMKEIKKGWSGDKKYVIQPSSGPRFLLRKSPVSEYKRKALEVHYMEKLFAMGLPISEPLDIKEIKEDVYTLFSWVEGADAEAVLQRLSKEEQYRLGVDAGKRLKQIHSIEAPDRIEAWESKYERKINQKIQWYQNCPVKYEKGDLFLDYVERYKHLIKARPSSFQHGDYHVGNMILSVENELSIIDFNRWDYGDPWEEFNRIDFTAQLSPLFATGQVDGYFSGQPDPEFFTLLLLYVATNTLSALPWALHFSDAEVQTMKKKADNVLKWYDNMTRLIPRWYDETAKKGKVL